MAKIAVAKKSSVVKLRSLRCSEWVQCQQTNKPEKTFRNLTSNPFTFSATNKQESETYSTPPAGVGECSVEPKRVPLRRLRKDKLHLECQWESCRHATQDYEKFQVHVKKHLDDIHVMKHEDGNFLVCLWDICGHRTDDYQEMNRHISYHSYHVKLMAIGFNARATLELASCKKDSSKRNQLPPLLNEHTCMWTNCEEKFNDIQLFFDHVHWHLHEIWVCSWAGCGRRFRERCSLVAHVRSHSGERLIACYHCGAHFANNKKLREHLLRQNASATHACAVCGVLCGSRYLLTEHARLHVSAHACTLCDITAPTLAALAQHARYRHLRRDHTAVHKCPHCYYRAVTKTDLRIHVNRIHFKKKKNDREYSSGNESSEGNVAKKSGRKKYACHMCPKDATKVFSRGNRLTSHLVNVHGVQWPFGHSRFRYQICEDGMYRLMTTRFELLEISKKVVDGYSGPKGSITNEFEFNLVQKSEPTETTPKHFEIKLKGDEEPSNSEPTAIVNEVEITMCDVDEEGNVLRSEVVKSSISQNVGTIELPKML